MTPPLGWYAQLGGAWGKFGQSYPPCLYSHVVGAHGRFRKPFLQSGIQITLHPKEGSTYPSSMIP